MAISAACPRAGVSRYDAGRASCTSTPWRGTARAPRLNLHRTPAVKTDPTSPGRGAGRGPLGWPTSRRRGGEDFFQRPAPTGGSLQADSHAQGDPPRAAARSRARRAARRAVRRRAHAPRPRRDAGRARRARRAAHRPPLALLREADRRRRRRGGRRQETWIRLWASRASYRPEGKLFVLLYTTARNLCRNRARGTRRRERWLPTASTPVEIERVADERPDHVRVLIEIERQRDVNQALGELPEPMREALLLRFGEGLAYEDIAAIVGASESTVRSRVFHGLKRLSGQLTDWRNHESCMPHARRSDRAARRRGDGEPRRRAARAHQGLLLVRAGVGRARGLTRALAAPVPGIPAQDAVAKLMRRIEAEARARPAREAREALPLRARLCPRGGGGRGRALARGPRDEPRRGARRVARRLGRRVLAPQRGSLHPPGRRAPHAARRGRGGDEGHGLRGLVRQPGPRGLGVPDGVRRRRRGRGALDRARVPRRGRRPRRDRARSRRGRRDLADGRRARFARAGAAPPREPRLPEAAPRLADRVPRSRRARPRVAARPLPGAVLQELTVSLNPQSP